MDLQQVYKELEKENVDIHTKYSYSHRHKTKGYIKRLSLGRIWFNLLLPDDYPLIDEPVTKKVLNKIIRDIVEKYDTETVADILTNIQREAFKLSSIVPVSLDEEHLILPDDIEEKRKKLLKDEDDPIEFQKKTYKITKEYLDRLKEQDSPIVSIIESGAKSSVADMANLMIARGSTVDIKGEISKPIRQSLNDGLDGESYYLSAKESRRALFIRSQFTAEPGYLARKVTFANANIELGGNDCKTTKYLELRITEDLKDCLIGRYYVDEKGKLKEITEDSDIIGKRIKLRSPLYCKEPNDNICKICYGKLADKLKDKNIGILAGSVINTEGIEGFSMKVRHKATQVNFKPVDLKKDLIESSIRKSEIEKFLDIRTNEIICKYDCTIFIDRRDYREGELDEFAEYFIVPGILNVEFPEQETTIPLVYNYSVKVLKSTNVEETERVVAIHYSAGDKIIEQDIVSTDTDMRLIIRLLDGKIKYIKDPLVLLLMIHDQLSKIALVHLEVIVSNMFRCAEDPKIKCRYKGSYKNSIILGQVDQPFVDSWLTSMAFERIKKAIKSALIYETGIKNNSLEKLMKLEFD